MSGQNATAEERVKSIKAQLIDTQLVPKKLTDESSRRRAKLSSKTSIVAESLSEEKTHVKRLEHQLATEVGKGDSQ